MGYKLRTFETLPAEIQYLVLDHCDAKAMAKLMAVNTKMNALVKESLALNLKSLLRYNRQFKLGMYPVYESSSAARWMDAAYLGTNNDCDFHYEVDSSGTCTCPRDLCVQSKFALSAPQGDEFVVDISENEEFAQVYLQVAIQLTVLGKTYTTTLLDKTQRVHRSWSDQDHGCLIHNHGLTYKMRVDRLDEQPHRNMFGDTTNRYKVVVTELVLNSAFLLSKVQRLSSISTTTVWSLKQPGLESYGAKPMAMAMISGTPYGHGCVIPTIPAT